MVVPLVYELFTMDPSLMPLTKAMAATVVCGALLVAFFRHEKTETISQREGMAIVAVGWTAIGLFGALPFYFSAPGFFVCGCLFRVRFRIHHHRFIDSYPYRGIEPGAVALAQFYSMAGRDGNHCAVHRHLALSGGWRDAAVQGGSAEPRAR